ncbi:MAG: RluA family pseudouridine synthase [Proteobacteria bacterium]|nr:RluA family pseudouridine synthase [Pseudomonadota bacterium]
MKNDVESLRLDIWLASQIAGLSRRQAQSLISRGDVTVDGRPQRKGARLKPGCEVAIWSEPQPTYWGPMPDHGLTLEVIYEDTHIIAVDKPSGIPSVPLSPKETGTLAGALVARYPECRTIGRSPGDGGLLQRLDQGTSGVILAARSASVYQELAQQQKRCEIEKLYLALIRRAPIDPPGRIDLPLVRAGHRGKRVKTVSNGIKAITEIRPVSIHGEWQLVEAKIHRGQRHQIRVHLASVGFPIAGDTIYAPNSSSDITERLFLHSSRIKMVHPVTKNQVELTSPLPPELLSFLQGK